MYIEKEKISKKSFLRIDIGRIITTRPKLLAYPVPFFRAQSQSFASCHAPFLSGMPVEQAEQERGTVEVLLLFVQHCGLVIAFEVFSIPPYSGYFSGILPAFGQSAT